MSQEQPRFIDSSQQAEASLLFGREIELYDGLDIAGLMGSRAVAEVAETAPPTQTSQVEKMTSNTTDASTEDSAQLAEREQIKKSAPSKTEETPVEEVPTSNKKGEELKAELDDLLDEIDEVLEENAEEFVRSYVQKGGQ